MMVNDDMDPFYIDVTSLSPPPSPEPEDESRPSAPKYRKHEAYNTDGFGNESRQIVKMSDPPFIFVNGEYFSTPRNNQRHNRAPQPMAQGFQPRPLFLKPFDVCHPPGSFPAVIENVMIYGGLGDDDIDQKTMRNPLMKKAYTTLAELLPNRTNSCTVASTLRKAAKYIEDLQNRFKVLMSQKYGLSLSQVQDQLHRHPQCSPPLAPQFQYSSVATPMEGKSRTNGHRVKESYQILKERLLDQPDTNLKILQAATTHIKGFRKMNQQLEAELFRCHQTEGVRLR